MNTYNCLLCGVGGQGTVLASKLIAFCAMQNNMKVRTSETIGMAQRGGSVVSHVRVSENEIFSPIIPKHSAQVIIAFEPGEAVRCLDYLADDGIVVVNTKAVMPTTVSFGAKYDGDEMIKFLKKNVKNLILADGTKICSECGSDKVLNIALLAIAANSGMLSMSVEDLKNAIKIRMKEQFHEINYKAIELAVGR